MDSQTADCHSQAHSLGFAEWAVGPRRFVRPLVSDLEGGADLQTAVAWVVNKRAVRWLLKGVTMVLDLGLVDRKFLENLGMGPGHSADRLAPPLVAAASFLMDC
jgi:hypothetical protein